MAQSPRTSQESAKGLLLALALAAGTITVGLLIPRERAAGLFSLLLFGIGAVYGGFVFSDGRRREVLIELGNFAVIAVVSFLGLWVSARWLIIGYFAHGGWDLVHHPRARLVQTRVPEWYAAGCVAYDWIVGVFLLFWLT